MRRRDVLAATISAPLLGSGIARAAERASPEGTAASLPAKPFHRLGIDRDRASFVLRALGLDALCLTGEENVRWATGAVPALSRLGVPAAAAVIIPADHSIPVTLICWQFSYYYSIADAGVADGVRVMLASASLDGDGAPRPVYFAGDGMGRRTPRETARIAATEATGRLYRDFGEALQHALPASFAREGRFGFDSLEARQLLEKALSSATNRESYEAPLHMRLIKTADEIAELSLSSEANRRAAHAAVSHMRERLTSAHLRQSFFAHAALEGNLPGFMVINGSMSENWVEPIEEGTSLLIDCVTHRNGYHGDYGRTVFIGEPRKAIARKTAAITRAWEELRAELEPGLSYSQVAARGQAILHRMEPGLQVPFRPHSLGLAHTEHPSRDLAGAPLDPILEAGMVISVDCPLLESGEGGTIHLEDLTLVTEDGSRPLHETGQPVLMI
ncbi:M24 family metallopeptidase [Altererythrobacter sp. MF3-039]|uniref:M24 family metallopeptidase n=1 Tax=Altererythrobacter sp. MF3-039 TaxID=3252901 RepID=UPI00390C836A